MRHTLTAILLALFATAGLGCKGSDALLVRGDIDVVVDVNTTLQVDFPDDTRLVRSPVATDGRVAGVCNIDGSVNPATFSVSVHRTPSTDPIVESLTVRDDLVQVTIQGELYEAAPGTTCDISTLYIDSDRELSVGVVVDCAVTGNAGTVTVVGELHFDGC